MSALLGSGARPIVARMKRNRSLACRALLPNPPLADGRGMTKRRRSKWLSSPQERAAVIAGVFGIIIALIGALTLNWQKPVTGAPVSNFHTIGRRDANFEHDYVSYSNGPRWTPVGMPRLNQNFQNAVFFSYGVHPITGKIQGPLGSGVLIGVESETAPFYIRHLYAVTCWHVAIRGGASCIRVNTISGRTRIIKIDHDDWHFVPGADDLCAVDVTDHLYKIDKISCVPSWMLATKDFIAQEEVGIGEDGFMLGLFAHNYGKNKNMIASRFGNVSLLADDDEPIEQPNEIKRPSHIFDMNSRPGFSGSPVFIYRTPGGDLRTATERGREKSFIKTYRQTRIGPHFQQTHDLMEERETYSNTFLMLLGIHAGQYPERVEAKKIKQLIAESSDDSIIRDGDKLKIPSSMTIVVPAWEIVNLLNLEVFQMQRKKRDEKIKKERDERDAVEPEIAEEISSSADNPTHREDFMRLSGAAARKQTLDE